MQGELFDLQPYQQDVAVLKGTKHRLELEIKQLAADVVYWSDQMAKYDLESAEWNYAQRRWSMAADTKSRLVDELRSVNVLLRV